MQDLLLDKNMDIHECIKKTEYENLDIIPSFLTLSEAEERMKADVRSPQQFRLKSHLTKIQDEYDYCIIDTSPSVSIININGLVAADPRKLFSGKSSADIFEKEFREKFWRLSG